MPLLAMEAPFWMGGFFVTATPVDALAPGGSYASWNLSAADSDILKVFAHGFKQTSPSGDPNTDVAPDDVTITPLTSAIALAGAYGVSVSATQITVTKQNAVGSGGAPAVKIIASRPHSITE